MGNFIKSPIGSIGDRHVGLCVPLDRVDVDTDQIIPKQFLKRIERTGFGEYLFHDWRYLEDGTLNPDFPLNQERYNGASILIARRNFGCGSSREHAPWALGDFGIPVIIAPSFADIFRRNCYKNGMLPIVLPDSLVDRIFADVLRQVGYKITVDLENQEVVLMDGTTYSFDIDAFEKYCLLEGLDEIGWTLQYRKEIEAFEGKM